MSKRIYYIILTIFIHLLCPIFLYSKKIPRAEQGVLDLSGWDFAGEEPVTLAGDWFVTPDCLRCFFVPFHPLVGAEEYYENLVFALCCLAIVLRMTGAVNIITYLVKVPSILIYEINTKLLYPGVLVILQLMTKRRSSSKLF